MRFGLIVLLTVFIIATLGICVAKLFSYRFVYGGDGWEIDVIAEVRRVVDGETFNSFPVERVSLHISTRRSWELLRVRLLSRPLSSSWANTDLKSILT